MDEKAYKWLGENQLSYDIWNGKYRYNNETLDEWFDRVSGGDKRLRQLIVEKKFLFGGRALANRGTGKKGSMFNCYSSGYAPDDINGLMQLNTNLALTYKAQGGQGVSLSKIRPKGTPIGNEFKSDGIVPFMEIFNATTASISQGGARKGALMMSLDIMHKEAETFITIKSNEDKITKANLSLEIDDEFMEAVKKYYETGEVIQIHEIRYYNGHKVEYDVTPIELYKLMIKTAYDWGEPACIYSNKFRNYNLMEFDDDYQIETCNPCGEQPLPKNFSCNLGSLNVSEFVKRPYTSHAYFDWVEFDRAVEIAVEALDNIIDENLNNHALKEQAKNSKNYRNIGLGIMGYANALFKLSLKYGSEDALNFTNELFNELLFVSLDTSCYLARAKGMFPKCKPEEILKSEIFNLMPFDGDYLEEIKRCGLRNCSLISVAPNGSIATMLGVSGGCEPEFALSYTRKTHNLKDSYEVFCKSVNEYWEMTNQSISEGNIKSLPEFFVTSADIPWRARIDTQAVMQRYVDTAISSTINLPKDISVEEIEQIYLYAWKQGLKGVTIFRSGCKRDGILSTDKTDKNTEESNVISESHTAKLNTSTPITREELGGRLNGGTYVKRIACGKLYITINRDENDNLVEVFIDSGKSGGCSANAECLGRFASAAMRNGMSIDSIVDITKGVKCSACTNMKGKAKQIDGLSCGDVLARTIQEEYKYYHDNKNTENDNKKKELKKTEQQVETLNNNKRICPECGNDGLANEGGCIICHNCGWSKCD